MSWKKTVSLWSRTSPTATSTSFTASRGTTHERSRHHRLGRLGKDLPTDGSALRTTVADNRRRPTRPSRQRSHRHHLHRPRRGRPRRKDAEATPLEREHNRRRGDHHRTHLHHQLEVRSPRH